MKYQISIGLFAVLAFLAGCTQNPYPTSGTISMSRQAEKQKVAPAFVLDVPATADFAEGTESSVDIRASVPEPGNALVFAYDLPPGAVLSPDGKKITWTPSYDAANEPTNPLIVMKTYPIRLVLRSSEDSKTAVHRNLSLIVRDVPRNFGIKLPNSPPFSSNYVQLREGQPLTQDFEVSSDDFPGETIPITFTTSPNTNLEGLNFKKSTSDPKKYTLSYTPGIKAVTVFDSIGVVPTKYFQITFTATSPRGSKSSVTQTWYLQDVRLDPGISAPAEITVGTEARFAITAEDRNGESAPRISVYNPRFGRARAELVQSVTTGGANPTSTYNITWDQIPVEKLNSKENLSVRVCVQRFRGSYTLCKEHRIAVTFATTTHKEPLVDRAPWKMGTIRYFRLNEKAKVDLSVADADSARAKVKVEVTPDASAEEVDWYANTINVNPKSVGLKQFNLKATSIYGAARVESFFYEVLPADWGKVLVLGETSNDPEVNKVINLFESVSLANPSLQDLDARLLSLRKLLVINTNALKLKNRISAMERAAGQISNVLISSPLFATLTGDLAAELKTYGLEPGPRLTEGANAPELGKVSIEPEANSGLSMPSKDIRLEGKLTSESKAPVTLKIAENSSCKPLIVGKKDAQKWVLAARCDRKNKAGKIWVAGFEWGDLMTELADIKIPQKWVEELSPNKR